MVDFTCDRLPTSLELPCSDDIPVDNEDQNFLPNFLLFLLQSIWAKRLDWFFGVDMAIYHTTGVNPRVPVVPDGFLSLGVERRKASGSRSSYVVWEENGIVPTFLLEVVSQTYGGEYDNKMEIYAKLDVLYYIVYNPNFCQRDQHQPFEVYKLVDGFYQLQIGEPFWMQEVGLGIGRGINSDGGLQREVLYWYNKQNYRYQTAEELLTEYRQQFGELPGS
ncbi:MAG: Uma2 family endonuclease [Tolypothrix carrinoi HA7290-LM1]|jgi:Uma2 family endonuclease|nr:Uma2 family endonuclease [Tolypothrix carrinoi HA7290-LM1]